MSIATKRGDGGQTGLAGGIRVSKADLRVESYGSIDELNTVLGFARSICKHEEVAEWTKTIQRTLFRVGSALATPPESSKKPPIIASEDLDLLNELVVRIESIEGLPLGRWLPGAHTESAAYAVARAVCRRAERAAVRFVETGAVVQPTILPYLNRLSDVLWLFARLLEFHSGSESSLLPELRDGSGFAGAR